ncbi:putative nuclear transport factor 2 domain protein [Erysiphe necator]|uniref:Putative nuclear transport factor 2 domain protein n=1 Tax=Uncinula necator TaxID=52586 RepID=A0A0B1P562_UNCNE|nr:putative nuclear transport factor 2 domain protein [Erysiphe necator]
MATLSEDVKVKAATSTAQDFIETYYPALNSSKGRSALASFYIKSENTKPDIIINGNTISSPTDFQKLFETQVQRAQYEVQSYDAHILNSNYNLLGYSNSSLSDKDGKRASVIVLISGSVKYWKEGEEANLRGFTESVVLVPDPEAIGPKSTKIKPRKWLIASQNFRLVS